MEKIVYKNGTEIAVITPTRNRTIKDKDGKESVIIGLDLAMKDIPKGAEYKIVDHTELPQDRIFRNAWNYDLKEDIPKAKEIWKEKLRIDRKPLFDANDIRFRDAYIINDTVELDASIAERDRLRDITNLVDSCKTIAAIKKVSV